MTVKYLVNFDTRQLPRENWDYVILGSGIAGLYTAHAASRHNRRVVVLTKHTVEDSNTDRAQGGIAAALGRSDSPALHLKDTLAAGAGLCDPEAVNVLVNEGPGRVRELMAMGAQFDTEDGRLALTREGAHSRRRILHAAGDATGAEIQRVLTEQARLARDIDVRENHLAVDLLVRDNVCYGVLALDQREGRLKAFYGRAVVLATGGIGQLFNHSTNPEVATGDGIALAYRAGAEVMDMEFIQFHPTVLSLPGAPRFLISEAVRGEGAYLRNRYGERFMPRYHELAELAPRDVVVRAILAEMAGSAADKVFLDLSHLDPEMIRQRFPTISRTLAGYGVDITRDPVPVAPAAHYMMGGVKTNLHGETSIERLYACGEVACQGVHGANRLASNSLLDGLVFGGRIVERVEATPAVPVECPDFSCRAMDESGELNVAELRKNIQNVMGKYVGPMRTAEGLEKALAFFEKWEQLEGRHAGSVEEMITRNMLLVGQLVAQAALMRTESRGGHYRRDYPEPRARWQKHIILRR
ncbi:L-aspartate oxidase [Desulfofundulus thermobenzoicus]|uniref:L-aspartate oxidase n=1 Tax=Desulfofundulus thermobenzoicus TaxID=29376 RepID=A0A6N7IV05_9FIRM|nr:L-aspartate oxidase [Desulfofundulus thermobenzoicus]MQL53277.1 L-aspartate oxidase [Desulfofundulus thermobenzoicus]HHW43397.1 L-aspartate oxidase [Desulfotomaculum sp.]